MPKTNFLADAQKKIVFLSSSEETSYWASTFYHFCGLENIEISKIENKFKETFSEFDCSLTQLKSWKKGRST